MAADARGPRGPAQRGITAPGQRKGPGRSAGGPRQSFLHAVQQGQERTIDDLHAYEREYRSRLKTYFTEQLKALGNGDDTLSPRNGFRPEARAQAHGHGV